MTEFKPGDRACFGGVLVTVENGPWRDSRGYQFYVVTALEGWDAAAMARDLTPVHVVKGDTMHHPVYGRVTVETDPLCSPRGASVVIRTESQTLSLVTVGYLRPARGSKPDTVEVDSVEYRLDRRYRDAVGDVWTLARLDGEVYAAHGALLDAAHEITSDHWPWEVAVAEFGPMTEVAE